MRLSTLSALACSTSMPISMCAPSVTALALTALEGRLLELCAPVFAPRIQIPEPAAVAAIYAQISAIETTVGEPLGVEATAAAVQGDWRLVFSDSASICKEGLLGYGAIPFVSSLAVLQRLSSGSVPAQTIEALELPLGAKNAVALKGDWRVDEDDVAVRFRLVERRWMRAAAAHHEFRQNIAVGAHPGFARGLAQRVRRLVGKYAEDGEMRRW